MRVLLSLPVLLVVLSMVLEAPGQNDEDFFQENTMQEFGSGLEEESYENMDRIKQNHIPAQYSNPSSSRSKDKTKKSSIPVKTSKKSSSFKRFTSKLKKLGKTMKRKSNKKIENIRNKLSKKERKKSKKFY